MKITATLLTFGEDTIPDLFGDVVRFAPGSLYMDERQRLPLLVEHDRNGPAVGYADEVWTEGDKVRATFTLLDTPAAAQVAAELSSGLRMDVSVGIRAEEYTETIRDDVDPHPIFGAPVRAEMTLADLVETSLTFRGRMPSAQVDDVSTEPTQGEA